ncbi:hypothetical protein N9E20_01595, partial [Crocinitomicaceae bacterium]|nr:hypothetical protein [Crocinitomicaceae bacterium]
MRKLLAFVSVFLLLNTSFGQDVGATFLQTPSSFTTTCPNPTQSIDVVISNFDAVSDFNISANHIRVTVNITGASTQTITQDVESGTILPGGNFLVPFSTTCDLSVVGTHVFTCSTSLLTGGPDVDPTNDTDSPVSVRVEVPTITLLSPGENIQSLCQNTSINSIVYFIGGGATNAVTAGLPLGLSELYDPSDSTFTISGSPSEFSSFPYTITTSGGCTPDVGLSGTIDV